MDRVSTAFALHVFRDLVCVRITFQMTGPSPPALGASSTSSRLLDLTGTGRWHRSRRSAFCTPRYKRISEKRYSCNIFLRSRTSAALAAVREAADHRLLDARTQGTRARAPVKVRPQKSHGEKLERCAKLRKVSDLMHAEDGVGRDGAVTAFWSST